MVVHIKWSAPQSCLLLNLMCFLSVESIPLDQKLVGLREQFIIFYIAFGKKWLIKHQDLEVQGHSNLRAIFLIPLTAVAVSICILSQKTD